MKAAITPPVETVDQNGKNDLFNEVTCASDAQERKHLARL